MSTTFRHKNKNKNYRAIAGGVTTIALIALGVVAAGAVGTFAFTSMGQNKTGLSGEVVSADVMRSGTSGAGTASVTVKNIGDVTISQAAVTIPSVGTNNITDIAPGQTKGFTVNVGSGLGAPGSVLVGSVQYTGPNGETQTDTFKLTIEGV